MKTTVSSKGHIVLPAELRRQDHVKAGQTFEIERIDEGEYRLKRTKRRRNEGLVRLLLACPVKGWFEPLYTPADSDPIAHIDWKTFACRAEATRRELEARGVDVAGFLEELRVEEEAMRSVISSQRRERRRAKRRPAKRASPRDRLR